MVRSNRRFVGFLVLGLLCSGALVGISVAQEMGGMGGGGPMGQKVTVTGYVRDTGCFVMRNLSGDSHVECALKCAKNGIPLGIEADNGTYYVAIKPGHPADSANPMLEQYAEKKVTVTGMASEAKGQHVLAVMKVEPAS
jgi:hypothetical protein